MTSLADVCGLLDLDPDALVLTGEPAIGSSALAVEEVAEACVGTALLAAARHTGRAASLDRGELAAVLRSEAFLLLNGASMNAFDPQSRFWPVADGWVRTHANYPWHRAALVEAFGEVPAPALADTPALEVEQRIIAAGGVAAAVREATDWTEEPGPLLGRSSTPSDPRQRESFRVLDLTRVIAGPTATRFLGALEADVLRIDPPGRPELPLAVADGLLGKRSAVLDVRDPQFEELLAGADVLVHGYRPGALPFGDLAERFPQLVVVQLSAWGAAHRRRGFDSIVQAATGIALRESPDGSTPGALPCQLLDHGTGYLCAAAALDGLHRRRTVGGTHHYELSLAATARWLLRAPVGGSGSADPVVQRQQIGELSVVRPPGRLSGQLLAWPGAGTFGAAQPRWH